MRFEFSAGGVVFNRVDGQIFVIVAQHSSHHGWVFPKGLIGDHPSVITGKRKKESKEEAAIREVEEETGVKAKIIKPLTPVSFWYVWESEKRKKTVYYFLMEFLSGDIAKHDKEMENVEWLPLKQIKERLTYDSEKKVFKEALQFLNT